MARAMKPRPEMSYLDHLRPPTGDLDADQPLYMLCDIGKRRILRGRISDRGLLYRGALKQLTRPGLKLFDKNYNFSVIKTIDMLLRRGKFNKVKFIFLHFCKSYPCLVLSRFLFFKEYDNFRIQNIISHRQILMEINLNSYCAPLTSH